jgi:hypothetical protein
MPIYVSLLGHVELPSVDNQPPRQIPDVRVDRRPARRRRRRLES